MDYVRLGYVRDFDKIRMKSYRVMGKLVAIVREADGSFWATEIACKHQNADLTVEGRWEGDVVTCTRHFWKYNLRTGRCLNQDAAPLRKHGLKVIAGELHVSLQPIEEERGPEEEPMPEIIIRPKE